MRKNVDILGLPSLAFARADLYVRIVGVCVGILALLMFGFLWVVVSSAFVEDTPLMSLVVYYSAGVLITLALGVYLFRPLLLAWTCAKRIKSGNARSVEEVENALRYPFLFASPEFWETYKEAYRRAESIK